MRVLTRRQARWAQFLIRFEFKILYRPGSQQGKANSLSRRTYLAPLLGEATFDDQKQILLGPPRLQAVEVSHMPVDSSILNSIRQDLQIDVFAQEVLDHIDPNHVSCSKGQHPHVDYNKFTWQNDLLFYKGLLYAPNGSSHLKVLQHCHDTYMVGHFGIQKTLELVSRAFWWPKLHNFVEEYVHTCDTCCRTKMPRHHPYGLLQPLPITTKPWQSISLDFITDLPLLEGLILS